MCLILSLPIDLETQSEFVSLATQFARASHETWTTGIFIAGDKIGAPLLSEYPSEQLSLSHHCTLYAPHSREG
jgi:hypothetical protein